jgi:hypothetical protein
MLPSFGLFCFFFKLSGEGGGCHEPKLELGLSVRGSNGLELELESLFVIFFVTHAPSLPPSKLFSARRGAMNLSLSLSPYIFSFF